jgi:hypothetical protein
MVRKTTHKTERPRMFPESWLREFCNPPLSTQALADLLTMSGMEVEDLRPVAPPFRRRSKVTVEAIGRGPAHRPSMRQRLPLRSSAAHPTCAPG